MWFSLKRKPCGEIAGVFYFGAQYCGILTRRRWRHGRHFYPICNWCIKEKSSW